MTDYYFYPYQGLTGGTAESLDSLDGSILKDGDAAFMVDPTTKKMTVFILDEDSAAAEDGVHVVAPDSNAGDKRWIRTEMEGVFVQASGNNAARRLFSSKIGETLSVVDFGADVTGANNAVTAFQDAIDATPDNNLQVINVPRGNYAGNMLGLNPGNRSIILMEQGGVLYANDAPGNVTRVFASKQNNLTQDLWFITNGLGLYQRPGNGNESLLLVRSDSNNNPETAATVQFQRIVSAASNNLSNPKALRVYSNITDNNSSPTEWCISAELDTYSNVGSTGTTGVSSTVRKYGQTNIFGIHINALDYNTYENRADATAVVAGEIDTNAISGGDDPTVNSGLGIRFGLIFQPRVTPTGTPTFNAWANNTAYGLYRQVVPVGTNLSAGWSGYYYECTGAGNSHATTEPTWPTTVGNTVADGSVTWTCRRGAEVGTAIWIKCVTVGANNQYGHYRYGIAIEDDIAGTNPTKMNTAIQIRTAGEYGIRMAAGYGHNTASISVEGASTYGVSLTGNFTMAALRVGSGQFVAFSSNATMKMCFNNTAGYLEFYSGNTRRGYIDMGGSDHAL
jgi:hypothetical protein